MLFESTIKNIRMRAAYSKEGVQIAKLAFSYL